MTLDEPLVPRHVALTDDVLAEVANGLTPGTEAVLRVYSTLNAATTSAARVNKRLTRLTDAGQVHLWVIAVSRKVPETDTDAVVLLRLHPKVEGDGHA